MCAFKSAHFAGHLTFFVLCRLSIHYLYVFQLSISEDHGKCLCTGRIQSLYVANSVYFTAILSVCIYLLC